MSELDPGSLDEFRETLVVLGVSLEEARQASTAEELALLAVEALMASGIPRYTEADVAERAGLPVEQTRRLWRALGMADPPPDERIFTSADIEALSTVAPLLKSGQLEPELVLQMTRVVGSSLTRIAEAQVSALVQRLHEGGQPMEPEAGGLLVMPDLLAYVWQRQFQAAARRRLALVRNEGGASVAVGFADLVGFTALSQQVTDHELALIVDRFEALAYEVIAGAGGRVVKMIGDEVMFVADRSATAADIALTLSESYADDEQLSDVRVGLACGPVLNREGDLYGPVVNLASRIVNLAYAGSVVTSDEFHDSLADDPRWTWRSMRRRHLKDIGRVPLWVIRRAGQEDESPLARARAEGKAVRAEIIDRIRERAEQLTRPDDTE